MAGFVGARIKRLVPRCQIVFDMRGDIFAEAESQGAAIRAYLHSEVARVVDVACGIICVSESFRRKVVEQYPAVAGKITVIPCTASAALFNFDPQTRREVRERLALDARLVLVYCGALSKAWQVADQLIAAFRDFHAIHPTAHLLLVTPDVDFAWKLSSALGLGAKDVTVVSGSHAEVPRYLMAADVGLLFRRRDSVNAVASPTKLAEYLMTGLPVAATEGIGDIGDLFSANEFGALIGDLEDPAAIEAAIYAASNMPSSDSDRAARAATAAGLLSSERYLPIRLEVYATCKSE